MRRHFLATVACQLLVVATHALSCESPDSYSYAVLPSLPAVTERDGVVAQVEIVALEPASGRRDVPREAARVRVIEAIRGVAPGQELIVRSFESHMCVQLFERGDIGRRGYIAGVIDPGSGVFRGAWRGGRRVD